MCEGGLGTTRKVEQRITGGWAKLLPSLLHRMVLSLALLRVSFDGQCNKDKNRVDVQLVLGEYLPSFSSVAQYT